MRVASSGLGMGPHHAMQIAEKLYTQGYISYPRTESTQYAENFDLKDVLRQHQNASDWGQDVKELLAKGKISFTFQTLHKERGFLWQFKIPLKVCGAYWSTLGFLDSFNGFLIFIKLTASGRKFDLTKKNLMKIDKCYASARIFKNWSPKNMHIWGRVVKYTYLPCSPVARKVAKPSRRRVCLCPGPNCTYDICTHYTSTTRSSQILQWLMGRSENGVKRRIRKIKIIYFFMITIYLVTL